MRIRQESLKNTDNATVWNRLQRLELSCSYCPPHKNENQTCRKKHGVKKKRKEWSRWK